MQNTVPEWLKKASVYQINPRTFCSEGTIKAIIKELPFLKELGFEIIYLCPIFEEDDSEDRAYWSERQKKSATNNPKNPYRMNDYFKIDSEYGSMDDLREFVYEVHRLGMKAMLDLVYFHIGPNAPILKQHPEFAKLDEDGNIFLGEWHFPVFNYENDGLCEYLWSNMVYYIGEIGVDGFRCDVGDRVPLDFWEEGKRRIKAINPQVIMINEGKRADYLNVFDVNYGFYWHSCIFDLLKGEITAADVIETHTAVSSDYPQNALVLRDMDNHDTVTDWPYRIEEHFGSDCMELILALNYSIDGVPMVYCGNELADKACLSMFANRFFMGSFEVTDREALKNTIKGKRRIEIVKKLNAIKKENEALQSGKTEWIKTDHPTVLAFSRVSENEKMMFIGNYSKEAVDIMIESGDILLSNNAEINQGNVMLDAYGYIIMRGNTYYEF